MDPSSGLSGHCPTRQNPTRCSQRITHCEISKKLNRYQQCSRSRMFIPDPNFSIPDPGPHQRIWVFLTPKPVSKLSEKNYLGCSSRIRIFFHPGSRIRIPDSRVKKALDPGSVAATLDTKCTVWYWDKVLTSGGR
jgi:hypothetical protein